ncbi:MAG: nucleotidyltransferase family protein [Lachnospira sp.]
MQKEIDKTGEDMLYLITCALRGQVPDKNRVLKMELSNLFQYAKRHSLAAITYDALELLGESTGEGLCALLKKKSDDLQSPSKGETAASILGRWKETRDKALRKNLMLDIERKKLFSYLEAHCIWYMPLKGSVLKNLYPKQEMRQMADNDILFDAAYEEAVKDYFVREGYKVITYERGNHDVYEKEPVYNFEMHTALFGKAINEVWAEYYKDIKSKLKGDENSFLLSFTDEDFYIYFVVHAFKHFDRSGSGIRPFVDCYVYLNAKDLDWEYIERELDKLGVLSFEKTFRSTSMKIFGRQETVSQLTEEEYSMLCDSMFAGTYGNMSIGLGKKLHKIQGDENGIKYKTKMKYYISRLFPSMAYYKSAYPFLYRTKVFIPFFVIYRMIRGALFSRKRLMREAKTVLKKM